MDEMRRVRIVVRGRVQGVGYRLFAQRHAQRHRIRGTVCNMPDGRSVEILAEADPAALDAFLAELRKGPPMSHISELAVDDIADGPPFQGFTVVV